MSLTSRTLGNIFPSCDGFIDVLLAPVISNGVVSNELPETIHIFSRTCMHLWVDFNDRSESQYYSDLIVPESGFNENLPPLVLLSLAPSTRIIWASNRPIGRRTTSGKRFLAQRRPDELFPPLRSGKPRQYSG
jgi:hypothetical protein